MSLLKVYFIGLFSWLALYLVFGDGAGYLGLANALAVYFFVPLPFAMFFAWRARAKMLLGAGALALVTFAMLWGPLILPQQSEVGTGERLRILSFNVLGRRGEYDQILATIRAEDADVLMLQEVTPEVAAVLQVQLGDEYPFQVLDARRQASGIGVLSRYPLESMDVTIGGRWIGDPQVLRLDWNGQPVTLVNFHTRPTGSLWPGLVRYTFAQREEDMVELATFAAREEELGPVIVAGDANVTHLNEAYKSINAVLDDAWWQAGGGLGHTFPAPLSANSVWTQVSFLRIPPWLVRIDYIFYSQHWGAQKAWLAEFNGGSDHRGVVAELEFLE